MLNTSTQFERVAKVVTERLAQLLGVPVFVINENSVAIASSQPEIIGLHFHSHCSGELSNYLRLPLPVETQVGEVLVEKPLNEEVVFPRLAQVLVEMMIDQTAALEALPDQHQLKNKFIYDLLHGLIDDEAKVLRHSKLLGLDLSPPRAVILIDAADYLLPEKASLASNYRETVEAQAQKKAQLVIESIVSFFHLPNDTICAYLGEGEVAVLKASDTKNLVSWANCESDLGQSSSSWANLTALSRAATALLRRLQADTGASISIGIGRYHPGISGLARSYQDARAALSIGCRYHGPSQVHRLDRLGVATFIGVSDEQTKVELATHLLSPLDHELELIATLDAFFAVDCCPSFAASQLSIHRNTLSYRLDKIASLTGLDPRRFDDAVQIRLALLLRKH